MTMDTEKLITDEKLQTQIAQLREQIQNPDHAISDVVDSDGNQYVDLVMEGGGMLGIALVGYTWALEEMGIRFLGIGGTSAGSINALLLAAMADPADKKSPLLLKAMGNLDFYSFVDGDGTDKGRKRTRALIELALNGKPIGINSFAKAYKLAKLIIKYWGVHKQLRNKYGLSTGNAFTTWLTDLLQQAGISDTKSLQARMDRIPELSLRPGSQTLPDWQAKPGRLVVIASDITTETRVEFPAMADLYWQDVDQVNPASYARASMSIPYFFETFRVTDLPNSDAVKQHWSKIGVDLKEENHGGVPIHALFVDGGITSNFPIDAFHNVTKVPTRPTFGVKLQYDDRYKPPTKLPLFGGDSRQPLMALGGAMFNSARHTLDYEFIKKHPDYQNLVQFIPCTYEVEERDAKSGKMEKIVRGYNWLDFNMPNDQREGLFRQGAQEAIAFVKSFSDSVDIKDEETGQIKAHHSSRWAYYKALRKSLMAPH